MFWGGIKKEMEEQDLYEPLEEHSSGKQIAFIICLPARRIKNVRVSRFLD